MMDALKRSQGKNYRSVSSRLLADGECVTEKGNYFQGSM